VINDILLNLTKMHKKAPLFNLKREREVLKLYIFQLLFTSLLACIIHEFNFM